MSLTHVAASFILHFGPVLGWFFACAFYGFGRPATPQVKRAAVTGFIGLCMAHAAAFWVLRP